MSQLVNYTVTWQDIPYIDRDLNMSMSAYTVVVGTALDVEG